MLLRWRSLTEPPCGLSLPQAGTGPFSDTRTGSTELPLLPVARDVAGGERIAFTAAAKGSTAQAFRSSLECSPICDGDPGAGIVPGMALLVTGWAADRIISRGEIYKRWIFREGHLSPSVPSLAKERPSGRTWNRDGVIIISRSACVLYRVDAVHGDPKPLRPFGGGETAQRWPLFLPDGNHYLYLSISNQPDQPGYLRCFAGFERAQVHRSHECQCLRLELCNSSVDEDVLVVQPFDLRNLKSAGRTTSSRGPHRTDGNRGPSPGRHLLGLYPWCAAAWRHGSNYLLFCIAMVRSLRQKTERCG